MQRIAIFGFVVYCRQVVRTYEGIFVIFVCCVTNGFDVILRIIVGNTSRHFCKFEFMVLVLIYDCFTSNERRSPNQRIKPTPASGARIWYFANLEVLFFSNAFSLIRFVFIWSVWCSYSLGFFQSFVFKFSIFFYHRFRYFFSLCFFKRVVFTQVSFFTIGLDV